MVDLATWMLEKFTELIKGALAPVLFFKYSWDWQDVRGMAAGVATDIKPDQLTASDLWFGAGEKAYAKQIPPQSDAASRVADISGKIALSLAMCAVAGLAFYTALGFIIAQYIASINAALAALLSGIFSWAGERDDCGGRHAGSYFCISDKRGRMTLLGATTTQMQTLHGEAVDPSSFPGGNWPDATPGHFQDATVTDGDADWSLKSQ